MDVADAYVTFVRHSQDVLRDKVNEEMYIERLFDVSKCLLLLAAQGGEPPKCDKMRDRRISHILRKWIGPDSLCLRLLSVMSVLHPLLVWLCLRPSLCDMWTAHSLPASRHILHGTGEADSLNWQRPSSIPLSSLQSGRL